MIMAGLHWLWTIFASFWFWLDNSIYALIENAYNLLMQLSRTSIFSQSTILEVAERIQILLGIFMLFKVGFSLIMYVVNPDDFSDQSKGIGKLLQNTIISLILLIVVPYIFNMAYRLQAMILEDNTIARLVMGNKQTVQYNIMSAGERMKFEVMMPFFQPNVGEEGLSDCINFLDENSGKFNKKCYEALKDMSEETDHVYIENYKRGVEQGSFGLTFRLNLIRVEIKDHPDDATLIDYKWPLTTISGIIVCLLLINFCIDVALRSVKLSFLQIISPVPIISYMDPKSGKDGMFAKWYKMCFSTYISLFVRLLALFLGIFIITNLSSLVDNIDGSQITNPMVKIFIIIGVLFFIKQLPNILKDLGFNIDGDAKFNLNPFKKIEEGATGGKRLTGMVAGAAIGFAGNKGLRRITGLAGGATRGIVENNGFKGQKDRQADINRKLRQARRDGYGFFGRLGESYGAFTGAETGSERFENMQKQMEAKKKFDDANLAYAKGVRSHILEDLENKKESDFSSKGMTAWVTAQRDLRAAQANYQAAANSGNATRIQAAKDQLAVAQDRAVDTVLNSGQEDGYLTAEREKFNIRIEGNKDFAKASHGALKKQRSAVDSTTIKDIKDYSQSQVNVDEQELYRVSESDEASRHRGNKTAAEAKKYEFK